MWGATRKLVAQERTARISIHAPRVVSDIGAVDTFAPVGISIHAPRVGSDQAKMQAKAEQDLFQSTLPVWGATSEGSNAMYDYKHFNPRSPCGERLLILTVYI